MRNWKKKKNVRNEKEGRGWGTEGEKRRERRKNFKDWNEYNNSNGVIYHKYHWGHWETTWKCQHIWSRTGVLCKDNRLNLKRWELYLPPVRNQVIINRLYHYHSMCHSNIHKITNWHHIFWDRLYYTHESEVEIVGPLYVRPTPLVIPTVRLPLTL